jgi:hypothetical protein
VSAPNPSTPEATRPVPFEMPLQRGDYGDDICDDRGKLVANLYGDERDPKTVAQRDYVVRAVNSYDDMLAALKAAQEELRLLHMKDTATVYNPGLNAQISLAISKAGAQ